MSDNEEDFAAMFEASEKARRFERGQTIDGIVVAIGSEVAFVSLGGKSDAGVYTDFDPALTVMTTVISKRHPHQCTIDAGNKALLRPTDEVKGRPEVKVENQGAEYGILAWKDGDRDFKLGDRVELYPSNLDMSTNVYDRYYVARGEQIVDVWPIMGRAGAAQR